MSNQLPLPFGDYDSAEEQYNREVSEELSRSRPNPDFGVHLLALGKIPGVGVKTLQKLVSKYEDLSVVWDEDTEYLRIFFEQAKTHNADLVAQMITNGRDELLDAAAGKAQQLGERSIRVIAFNSPDFPQRLAEIPSPPKWLFVEGDVSALHGPLIGIVGTRQPTPLGMFAADRATRIVASEGLGVVSGLAEGIDDRAHKTAINYKAPQVAVLGTGIEQVFPASTGGTRMKILETGGAVITEYLPGESYGGKAQFVERNRIQAGLASAMIPVESKSSSGTAHTLRFAEQLNRVVLGVLCARPDPENTLLKTIVQHHHRIFDLNEAAGAASFVAALKEAVGVENWPVTRRTLPPEQVFAGLLRQVYSLSLDSTITSDDWRWLLKEIENLTLMQNQAEEG